MFCFLKKGPEIRPLKSLRGDLKKTTNVNGGGFEVPHAPAHHARHGVGYVEHQESAAHPSLWRLNIGPLHCALI